MNIRHRFLCLVMMLIGPLTSCDSGPCQGSECAGSSMGSGHFTPGPFAHSAVELDGPRCTAAGVSLDIFQHRLFTDPDPPQTVHQADTLTVYWSVCNSGSVPSAAQTDAYQLVVDEIVSSSETNEIQRTTFSIPALDSCHCAVGSVPFTNQLQPGRYHFSLEGQFSDAVDRVVSP